jgi:asparagine synthase (glutamine-hydrolysing)
LDSSVITALSALELREPIRSFSVDFVDHAENFTPTELRPTMDTPYVHDVVQHVGTHHSNIVLDHYALADPEIRRRLVAARDLPIGFGDMDASLYLLFKAIREKSTVALSGESADEVFGGYLQFHDPKVQQTDAFPWIAIEKSMFDTTGRLFTSELRSALNLDTFMQDRYAEAVAEVARVEGEDAFTHRMRVMSYLHLTRFVRLLLDRKDRMSMAVGLEVRVPFCDHRLVEYVYNTPWSLKTYDGREKSLLRGAARDVLPDSVAQRVKSPYPSIQDAHYVSAIQQQAKDLLGSADEVLFNLVDRDTLEQMTQVNPATLPQVARNGLECALDFATWLDIYQPEVVT